MLDLLSFSVRREQVEWTTQAKGRKLKPFHDSTLKGGSNYTIFYNVRWITVYIR